MRVRELLEKCGIGQQESILCACSDMLLDFSMTDYADFTATDVKEQQHLSMQLQEIAHVQNQLLQRQISYQTCCERLSFVESQLHMSALSQEKMREYRTMRRMHLEEKQQLEQEAFARASMQLFGTPAGRRTLCFKGVLYASAVSELERILVQLQNVPKESPLRSCPVFTDSLESWKRSAEEGRRFAVEGGPCLFGAYECTVHLHMADGMIHSFDFVTEQLVTADGSMDDRIYLVPFVRTHADSVRNVSFTFSKPSLTEDEFHSMQYVFETAKAFRAKAYIPLPDFSYEKYLHAVLELTALPRHVRSQTEAQFHDGVQCISQMYLDAAELLKKEYPSVPVVMICAESMELLHTYAEKRSAFLNPDTHLMKTLTTRQEKRESILDYITMPALPYYLDGITDIIQVDCMDETDSYRKCRKLHRNVLTIHPFLYPEPISSDGVNTAYYAAPPHKKYRTDSSREV
ncbi:MAG: hypothetical protein IJ512_03590 [Ruminococcus sp.]|nr:hypothetical protein [Ruminococcus sp.]